MEVQSQYNSKNGGGVYVQPAWFGEWSMEFTNNILHAHIPETPYGLKYIKLKLIFNLNYLTITPLI